MSIFFFHYLARFSHRPGIKLTGPKVTVILPSAFLGVDITEIPTMMSSSFLVHRGLELSSHADVEALLFLQPPLQSFAYSF